MVVNDSDITEHQPLQGVLLGGPSNKTLKPESLRLLVKYVVFSPLQKKNDLMVQPPTLFSSWGILSRLQQLFLTSILGIVCLFWSFLGVLCYLPLTRTCNNQKKKWCANCWIFCLIYCNIFIYTYTHTYTYIYIIHIYIYMNLVYIFSPNETQTPSTVRSLKKSPIAKTQWILDEDPHVPQESHGTLWRSGGEKKLIQKMRRKIHSLKLAARH